MNPFLRLCMSVAVGVVLSALAVVLDFLFSESFGRLGQAFDTAFMAPGYALSAPFHYSAYPLFRQLFGWSGPGGAYLQALLFSFLSWASLLAGAVYIFSMVRGMKPT
jgi:hypothetical protein